MLKWPSRKSERIRNLPVKFFYTSIMKRSKKQTKKTNTKPPQLPISYPPSVPVRQRCLLITLPLYWNNWCHCESDAEGLMTLFSFDDIPLSQALNLEQPRCSTPQHLQHFTVKDNKETYWVTVHWNQTWLCTVKYTDRAERRWAALHWDWGEPGLGWSSRTDPH